MTPNQLDEYLKVMRKNNVTAGALEMPWMVKDTFVPVKMSFQFGPEPLPDGDTSPGGWKGATSNLDTSQLDKDQKLDGIQ